MIESLVDVEYLFSNKAIRERDYNKLLRYFEKVFHPWEFRIPSIRHTFSDLTPFSYPQYVDLQNESPLINQSLGEGEDLFIDIDNVTLQFEMVLQSGFFPEFENEYFIPSVVMDKIDEVNAEGVQDGMLFLDNSKFRSLLLAAYEFETAVKERWAELYGCCDGMLVEVNFMVPAIIDGSFEIKIIVTITMVV